DGLAQERNGILKLALIVEIEREAFETLRHLETVRAEELLAQRERLAKQRLRRGKVTRAARKICERIDATSGIGVVVAEQLTANRQRLAAHATRRLVFRFQF